MSKFGKKDGFTPRERRKIIGITAPDIFSYSPILVPVVCGIKKCKKPFMLDPSKGMPHVAFCKDCEARINRKIRERVHAETGSAVGSFSTLDRGKQNG